MPSETSRTRRVGEQVKRELSAPMRVLAQEQSLGLITITAVDVSPDLRQARVLVTAIGGERPMDEIIAILNQHGGEMRHHLAHALILRGIPRLEFVYDESVERGMRMDRLLDSLHGDRAGREDEAE